MARRQDARTRLVESGQVVQEGKRYRIGQLAPGAGTGLPGRGVGWAGNEGRETPL